jgi:histidinol-phosphate aminotransferase
MDIASEVEVAGTKLPVNPLFLLDEAYIDFADSKADSAINLLDTYSNLIVVRTFSKSFGLAGLRVGYGIASPEAIRALELVRATYNLSGLTQALATVAFQNADELLKNVDKIKSTRDHLYDWLVAQKYQGQPLRVTPSQTNFIQIAFSDALPNYMELRQKALDFFQAQGIIVRGVGAPGFFRVSIGSDVEINAFKNCFSKFLD